MKIRGASVLVGCAVLLLMAAPPIYAQRGGGGRSMGGGGRGTGGGGRPVNPPGSVNVPNSSPRVVTTTIPSSPILPITNPVAPIVPTDGTAGTTRRVIIPNRSNSRRDNVILVGGSGFWPGFFPFYDGWSPQPYLEPAPVPGELPGTYRYQPTYDSPDSPPVTYAQPDTPPAPMPLVEPEPVYYPQQNMIVTLPEPDRVVEAPPLGTSRADALARFGEPWGSMKAGGKETLYFRGITLVFENGKVSEIR